MHAGAYLHDCLPPCMHACLHTCMHRYEYIHASLTSESGMHAFIHPCLHSSMHEQLDLPVWICMYGYAILCMHRKCSMVILKAFRASLVLSTKLETQQQKSCSATSGWDMSAYRAAGQPKIYQLYMPSYQNRSCSVCLQDVYLVCLYDSMSVIAGQLKSPLLLFYILWFSF